MEMNEQNVSEEPQESVLPSQLSQKVTWRLQT